MEGKRECICECGYGEWQNINNVKMELVNEHAKGNG